MAKFILILLLLLVATVKMTNALMTSDEGSLSSRRFGHLVIGA